MPALPTPFRAALGLVATVLDGAKDFPDKAIELPMLAVSSALQVSLRAQQRYAALCAKGDDLLAGRHTSDEPPPWATFDDPISPSAGPRSTARPSGPRSTARPAGTAKATGADAPRTPAPKKNIRAPRSAAPSAFDSVGDED